MEVLQRWQGGLLCWKGFLCPTAKPGCSSLCSPPQVTRISSPHRIRAWGGHGVVGGVCQAWRDPRWGEVLSALGEVRVTADDGGEGENAS